MEKEKYCYPVIFFAQGEKHEVYGIHEGVLSEKEVELFAWGVIRSVLNLKKRPLTGYATNIEVIDGTTNECIWKCDIIEIPSSDEMQNAIQNKN